MVKIKICIEEGCQNAQTTEKYCRLHYLKNWKKIREATQKKAADRLNNYVEGICKKHPDRYVDVIRREIKTGSGEIVKATDAFGENMEEGLDVVFHDDENLDQLLSRIKVDKDF